MSNKDVWFPLYVADYLADTMHLTTEEHGAYLLLLMAYFRNQGPLPNDTKQLARIARLSPAKFKKIEKTLSEFFQISEIFWTHKRAEKEIKNSQELKQRRNEKARKAAASRWSDHSHGDATSNATSNASSIFQASSEQSLEDTQSQSQSHIYKYTHTKITPPRLEQVMARMQFKVKDYEALATRFLNYYNGNGWMVGRVPMDEWEGMADNWAMKEAQYESNKRAGGYRESKAERANRRTRELIEQAESDAHLADSDEQGLRP